MMRNVLEYLETSAARVPDKTALIDEHEQLSYREYLETAKRIGSYLIRNTAAGCRNKPIAVVFERNVWSVAAFMGVVYSGNFYVPIDNTMPAERISLIYDTLDPVAIIDARSKNDKPIEGAVLLSDILAEAVIDEELIAGVREGTIDTDPLYGIFTSGSTGVPKGIVPCHRSIIDLVDAFDKAFDLNEDSVHGSQAPLDFDAFVKDIYNAMHHGATVVIIPKKFFSMPKLLIDFMVEKNVNTIIWAVSACRIVSDFKTFGATEKRPALKYVMFSGEVMPTKALNYWMDNIPDATYVNLYGPTETTCNCTYYIVEGKQDLMSALPIGKPFANTRVVLLDEKRQNVITEPGVKGELCVSGTCLALGYWNNPQKTHEAFFRDPTISAYDSILYGTGDLAYYAEDGKLMFASRRDFQIKHMGHRIELGEIEVALNAIPYIDVAVCLYDQERGKIVCFYQSEVDDSKAIVKFLADKLPKFMWPTIYRRYDRLPANKNGKIDRVKLKEELGK